MVSTVQCWTKLLAYDTLRCHFRFVRFYGNGAARVTLTMWFRASLKVILFAFSPTRQELKIILGRAAPKFVKRSRLHHFYIALYSHYKYSSNSTRTVSYSPCKIIFNSWAGSRLIK